MQKMKIRTIRIDDWLWKELEKTANITKQNKSNLIRTAIIEKIQRIELKGK